MKFIIDNLSNLKNIKSLNFSFNCIKKIDLIEIIQNFEGLKSLDFSNNLINKIKINKKIYHKNKTLVSKLKKLDLSFNSIKNMNEILDLINYSFLAFNEFRTKNNYHLFWNLAKISFYGNPIPIKLSQYFIQNKIDLFNFIINPILKINKELKKIKIKKQKSEITENNEENTNENNNETEITNKDEENKTSENSKHIEPEPEIKNIPSKLITEEIPCLNIEKIYNETSKILKDIEEDFIQQYKETNDDSYFTEVNLNKSLFKSNLNSDTIKNIVNIDIDINGNKSDNNIMKSSEKVSKMIKNSQENFINHKNIEKKIIYNLIDDLRQFNVIYDTYSFKKTFENFNQNFIFREKVDKDKFSNVLLMSKQKIKSSKWRSQSNPRK